MKYIPYAFAIVHALLAILICAVIVCSKDPESGLWMVVLFFADFPISLLFNCVTLLGESFFPENYLLINILLAAVYLIFGTLWWFLLGKLLIFGATKVSKQPSKLIANICIIVAYPVVSLIWLDTLDSVDYAINQGLTPVLISVMFLDGVAAMYQLLPCAPQNQWRTYGIICFGVILVTTYWRIEYSTFRLMDQVLDFTSPENPVYVILASWCWTTLTYASIRWLRYLGRPLAC